MEESGYDYYRNENIDKQEVNSGDGGKAQLDFERLEEEKLPEN